MLHPQGGSISLESWYPQKGISIVHVAFACGNDELVLVDSNAQARIFSFMTQQFRYEFYSFIISSRVLFTYAWKTCFHTVFIGTQRHIFVPGWFLPPGSYC